MKSYVALAFAFTLSFAAQADLGEYHYQEMCQNEEVKALVGETGKCNVVMAPSSNLSKGSCKGLLVGKIPCTITYDTTPTATVGMRVVCGESATKPLLDQRLDISSTVYNVNALIKTSENKSIIRKDSSTYSLIQSSLINMMLIETATVPSYKTAVISFILNDRANPITNVVCQ